jgi:1-acyl-sn-glycerol-3-phosphate acyltransferase
MAGFKQRAGTAGDAGRCNAHPGTLPTISDPLLRLFTWYSRWYLRRHFHTLRISRSGFPPSSRSPLVVYSNHASWWDPLVWLVLRGGFFPGHRSFAPIDAAALEKYKMFRKFGFFGVQQGTPRGARQFLKTAEAILARPGHILAITAQGRFADVRERPIKFQAGLGHLAARVPHATFVPMAAEYVLWEERLPEILVRFGEAVEVDSDNRRPFNAGEWTALFEGKLEETQDALATESLRRDPADFNVVLRGGAGQGGIYDFWRAIKAASTMKKFAPGHGNL